MTLEQKVDLLLTEMRDIKRLLHGSEDVEGLVSKVEGVRNSFWGHGDDLGDHHRTHVMWRFHVWLLCSGSAGLGGLLFAIAQWAAGKF